MAKKKLSRQELKRQRQQEIEQAHLPTSSLSLKLLASLSRRNPAMKYLTPWTACALV
ncbi:MAG: hypothetical protein L0332_27200 [Chloroflexi bacterium]|nr:hypothetical protein [Chloroflexota bacterium]MCI0577148.1 hypothetical protein [Chloroflexota bacterium]MCI0644688.1 hypothetical protein [Chloroflexota bacterium]MCI0730386.1 hypothetical protein [Chloroflexota bacterium]